MLDENIKDLNFVVFDIETTGFDPVNDQIIEIGAVKLNFEGKIVDKFSKFVTLYSTDKIPTKIIELTHITDEMLIDMGEEYNYVMKCFYEFIKDNILIAQNAKFDMSFIDTYYLKNNIFLDNIVFDTIDLAKYIYPDKKTYKLSSLIEYFEIDYDKDAHHRADYDAQITSEIFVNGMKKLYAESKIKLRDYEDVFLIEEASQAQKKYLHTLMKKNDIKLEKKIYLTKFNAMRQISIFTKNDQ